MALFLLVVVFVCLYFGFYLTFIKLPRCQSQVNLTGKTVIVTGGNAGIGKTTAMDLARRGAKVILACRDRSRAEGAVKEIIQATGNTQVVFMQLDLASLQSVQCFVETFVHSESRLDILINNAGVIGRGETEEGFGLIFGVNHLGHFLLTVKLLDLLKKSGHSRVVNVASTGYKLGQMDFDCLRAHKSLAVGNSDYDLFQRYCHSKLCNVLFTYELAKRLQDTTVTCYSIHPGSIKTEIGRNLSRWWKLLLTPIVFLFFVDAVSGAQTTLHCALKPGIEHLSGHYFSKCAPVLNIESKARDDATARRLWELSESFCGIS